MLKIFDLLFEAHRGNQKANKIPLAKFTKMKKKFDL